MSSYQRSAIRGPGSNQHGDKPPLPASPFEQKYRQQRAEMLQGALADLSVERDDLRPPIDLSYFYNEQSGMSPEEWETDFTDAAERFIDGKVGAQGRLFGLMQFVPVGSLIPEHIIPELGSRLRSDGLFTTEYPEEVDSDVAAVAAAFDRALYSRLYSEAFREETRVLEAIETSEEIVGQSRHLVGYLGEKNLDMKILGRIVDDSTEKAKVLDDLAVGDNRDRSHFKANVRVIKKGMGELGTDRKRIKEHAFAVENYAMAIDRQVRAEYVGRAPFWMEAIHNRSFFALRSGNYPSLQQYLEEIDAMAQKSFECTNGLPVRDATSRKRQLKRVQRAIRNIQDAMAPYANSGEEAFRPPQNVVDQFADLRTAIFS